MNTPTNYHRGSTLLAALMITSILMTLALGVSELVVRMSRDSRVLIDTGIAWYAAESGVERALLDITTHPPGYERSYETDEFTYHIEATSTKVPNPQKFEIKDANDEFGSLAYGDSITIPIFSGDGDENQVKKIRVDYFLAPDLKLRSGFVNEDLDILRWRIFGIATDGVNAGKMEVLNEFIPMESGKDTAASPTCFGTRSPECWNTGTYYQYHLTEDGQTEFDVIEEYFIQDFLAHHKQNFLIFTNMVDADLISPTSLLSDSEKKSISNIRYRITDMTGGNTKRIGLPTIAIKSDGNSNGVTQSIDVAMRQETFLPVFNYALYRTALD